MGKFKILIPRGDTFHHSLRYNPHFDGLRGIAIILVILFHFFPEIFPFGFVGVDIFFVLSGYLITFIILSKLKANKFSFKEFYRNRVRRLFPALIFVLIFSLILGYFFLFPEEFKDLGKHIKSSALYYQNFNLMNEIGYWDKEALYKPLLHIWSLSVEEQFYLFWPIFLLFLYKKNKVNLKNFLILLLFLFSLSIYLTYYNAEKSFYNTLSRAWELTIGAFTAFLIYFYKSSISKFVPFKLIKYNFLFFLLAVLLFYKTQIYSPIKLLVLTLIVSIWIIKVNFYKDKILGNQFLIFIGLISYSLYLWHYTLLSYAYIFGYINWKFKVFILFLSFFLAYFTYVFIEIPFRKKTNYKPVISLIVILLLIAFLGHYIYANDGLKNRPIVQSVKEQLKYLQRDKAKDDNCLKIASKFLHHKPKFDYCRSTTYDSSKIEVVLIGDSHAHVLYTGLESILKKNNIDILLLANSGCPPYISGERGRNLREVRLCKEKIQDIYNILNNLPNIKFIIFSTRIAIYATEKGFGIVEKSFSKNPSHFKDFFLKNNQNYNPEKIFFNKIEKTFKYFLEKNIKVFYILENPELGFNPKTCLKRLFIPPGDSCKLKKESYLKRQKKYREKLKKLAMKYKNVIILDLEDIFCDSKYCYLYKQGKFLYVDDDHLSKFGSFLVGEKIFRYLKMFYEKSKKANYIKSF